MRRLILVLVLAIIPLTYIYAQIDNNEKNKKIVLAINNSNIDYLVENIDNKILITILKEKAYVSKAQAKIILKDFFKANKLSEFSPNISSLNNNTLFMQGIAKSGTKKYNVKIKIQIKEKNVYITEIIIEYEY